MKNFLLALLFVFELLYILKAFEDLDDVVS